MSSLKVALNIWRSVSESLAIGSRLHPLEHAAYFLGFRGFSPHAGSAEQWDGALVGRLAPDPASSKPKSVKHTKPLIRK
jgi:hypothetical protein